MNSPTSITGGGLMSDVIAADGYGQHEIIRDGKIHRFTHPDDKPGSNNCWYVSFGTGGAFGSWRLGFTQTWHDGNHGPSANDAKLREQIEAAKKQRQAEIKQGQKNAAADASRLWGSGSQTITSPYPVNKEIKPYGSRQYRTELLIPMYHQGKLVNIQRILPSGKKLFLKGGRVTSCYLPLGDLSGHLHICEGYATGCSLLDYLPAPATVCVAFNDGNLKAVAFSIRKKYPDIRITIACDNDTCTPGNPGLTKGLEAAAAVDGDYIYPDFSDESFGEGMSDFNDYLVNGGSL